jgi:hypothetical protein
LNRFDKHDENDGFNDKKNLPEEEPKTLESELGLSKILKKIEK